MVWAFMRKLNLDGFGKRGKRSSEVSDPSQTKSGKGSGRGTHIKTKQKLLINMERAGFNLKDFGIYQWPKLGTRQKKGSRTFLTQKLNEKSLVKNIEFVLPSATNDY